jgi:AcrR family transcriptional regulator
MSLSIRSVAYHVAVYIAGVPKLWTDTIEDHRREVRDAVLDTTAALVAEGGLLSVTMSGIAEATGIGRATLYKYFPDVDAILTAWHERQIADHLTHLREVGVDQAPGERLESVLGAYAFIRHQAHGHHGTELATALHEGDHITKAEHDLHLMIQSLLDDAAAAGDVRADVPTSELASFCLHALGTATSLPSKAAVHRLVGLTIAGLKHPAE